MAKRKAGKFYFVARDSHTGRFLSKKKAAKRNPATWENERRKRNASAK